jgi:hypothetical protein
VAVPRLESRGRQAAAAHVPGVRGRGRDVARPAAGRGRAGERPERPPRPRYVPLGVVPGKPSSAGVRVSCEPIDHEQATARSAV